MTKEQQQEIIRLKSAGLSFSKIAEQLGLPRNTVKSFYQRKHDSPELQAKATCKQCGAPLFPKPGHAMPRFCSDRCRSTWWNMHNDELSEKGKIQIACKNCGTIFSCYPSSQRDYCSRECYFQSRYEKMPRDYHEKTSGVNDSISTASADEDILSATADDMEYVVKAVEPKAELLPADSSSVQAEKKMLLQENYVSYLSSMAVYRQMLMKELISQREFELLDDKMKQKYDIPVNTIFSDRVIDIRKK